MTCREPLSEDNITRLHTRQLLLPKHCAWHTWPEGDAKRAKQRQLRRMLGSTVTPRERAKVSQSITHLNRLEEALHHYRHPYAICTMQQIYDIIRYLEDRCSGKIKSPKGITKRCDSFKKPVAFLREIVKMQGHLPELAKKGNWREESCIEEPMRDAREHDGALEHMCAPLPGMRSVCAFYVLV